MFGGKFLQPDKGQSVVQLSDVGPEPAGDTGHDSVAGNRKASCRESRLGVVGALRSTAGSAARRGPRDSRNIAIALALLALAAIMFLVTMVKFDEQMYGNGLVQTRFDRQPPQVRGSATISSLFDLAEPNCGGFRPSPGSPGYWRCRWQHGDHHQPVFRGLGSLANHLCCSLKPSFKEVHL